MSQVKETNKLVTLSSSTSTNATVGASLLPQEVIAVLQKGPSEGYLTIPQRERHRTIDDKNMPELCDWIVKLGDQTVFLLIEDTKVTSAGASFFFDKLRTENVKAKYVRLQDSPNVDDKCIKSIGEYIKTNKFVEIINLERDSITDAGIEALVPYLEGNTTFKGFYLSGNYRISDKSIPHFLKMIESSRMDTLFTIETSVSKQKQFVVPLARNVILSGSQEMALFGKEMDDDDIAKICEYMKTFGIGKLKKINLDSSKITSKGASLLFNTLKECNSTATYLGMSYNQLDDECLTVIGEYLQENKHLERLNMGNANFTDRGIEVFSEYIIGNTTLQQLAIHDCKGVTDASVPYIIEMVKKSHITGAYVFNSSITAKEKVEIEIAQLIPIEQREIPIKSNTKSASKTKSESS